MVNINCLLKDTRIVDALGEILESNAAGAVLDGGTYSLQKAYSDLKIHGIEIDLESTAAIYSEIFDLTDDVFTPSHEIDFIVGRTFENTVERIKSPRHISGIKRIGILPPGKAAAKQVADMFEKGMMKDTRELSIFRKLQEAVYRSTVGYLNKKAFPDENIKKIKELQDQLELPGITEAETKAIKEQLRMIGVKENFQSVLEKAFSTKNIAYERKDGGLNTILDVLMEFQTEIRDYINELDRTAVTDEEKVKAEQFKKYVEVVKDKMFELFISESETRDILKQILIKAGYGKKVGNKKDKLVIQIRKYNKIDTSDYTVEEKEELKHALEKAEKELADVEYTESEILRIKNQMRVDPYDIVGNALLATELKKHEDYISLTNMTLDWKKLTFIDQIKRDEDGNIIEEGITAMKYNIDLVLTKEGYSQGAIDMITRSFENEYNRLKKDMVVKKLNELIRRNEVKVHPDSDSDVARLAKLYNLGWFNESPDKYENIVRNVLGVSEIDQKTFDELGELSKMLALIYQEKINDVYFKTALNTIGQKIGDILERYGADQNMFFKVVKIISEILSTSMRAMLTSVSNYTQNTMSGMTAVFGERIQRNVEGLKSVTQEEGDNFREMGEFIKGMSSIIFNDISSRKGVSYGDLSSSFMYRSAIDRFVDKIDNPHLQKIGTFFSGKMFLDAIDGRFKFTLTHMFFVSNMVKVLTTQHGYTKDEAMGKISEKLYGKSFDDYLLKAKGIVDKINVDSVDFPEHQSMIYRMAADMVLMNLTDVESLSGSEVTDDQVIAAYETAYSSAGYRIGHVPNNIFSKSVSELGRWISTKLNDSMKKGDYVNASFYKMFQAINMAFINPFGNGGMNWVVIMLESTGLGAIRAGIRMAPYLWTKKKGLEDFDITNPKHLADYQELLFEQRKRRIQMTRGLVGAAANLTLSLIAYTLLPGDDDEEKMENFNDFFEKNKAYYKYISWVPLSYLWMKNAIDNSNPYYLKHMLNLRFQDFELEALMSEAIRLWAKGDIDQAEGKVGEIVGTFAQAPIPSYRVAKQVFDLTYALGGLEGPVPLNRNDYARSLDFLHGFTKFGIINDAGYRIDPTYDRLMMFPGIGPKSIEHLEKNLKINSVDEFKDYLHRTYPDKSAKDAIRQIKKTSSDGKKMPLMSKEESAILGEFIETGNMPNIKLESFLDPKTIKSLKKKDIYTVYDLIQKVEDDGFDNLGLTPNEITEAKKAILKYK